MLLSIRQLGWRPLRDALDYLLWSPREFNTVADHAVNVTLDCQESWTKVEDLAALSGESLRLCVDGGLCRKGDAAAGLTLFSVTSDGRYKLRARKGVLLGKLVSAFQAEAIALECALEWFLELLA